MSFAFDIQNWDELATKPVSVKAKKPGNTNLKYFHRVNSAYSRHPVVLVLQYMERINLDILTKGVEHISDKRLDRLERHFRAAMEFVTPQDDWPRIPSFAPYIDEEPDHPVVSIMWTDECNTPVEEVLEGFHDFFLQLKRREEQLSVREYCT